MNEPKIFIGKSQSEVERIIQENLGRLWFSDKVISVGIATKEYDEGLRYVVLGILAEALTKEESDTSPHVVEEVPVIYTVGGGKPEATKTEN